MIREEPLELETVSAEVRQDHSRTGRPMEGSLACRARVY